MKNNLKKNFIWNIIGSTFNSFNSLFFLIIVIRVNGVSDGGLFSFCFSTACLFYVIGIYSGRTYQVTDEDKKVTGSDYLYSKIVTSIIMFFVGVIFCLIRGYDFTKTIILLGLVVFKMLEAFSEAPYALLQQKNQLYQVGISLFFKSSFSLISFLVVDLLTKNLLFSIGAVIFLNLLIIIFYDFRNLKKIEFNLLKIKWNKVVYILKKGFYAFGFAFLTQYVINSSKYAIDIYFSNSYQTIFGIILMPATVLVLLGQFIIQPFLTDLKQQLKEDKKKFSKTILKLCFCVVLLGIIAIVAAYFFGIPILNLLYGIKLNKYLWYLIMIIIGATIYEITVVLSTALITMRYTLSQLIIFIIASIFTGGVSITLVPNYKIFGASLTYLLTMIFLLLLYIIVYFVSLKKYKGVD